MDDGVACAVNSADCSVEADDGGLGDGVDPLFGGEGKLCALLFETEEAEEGEVEEEDKATGLEGEHAEDDVLRVVAGGVGDGGVREGAFLVGGDDGVVAEEAGADDEGDED